MDDVEFFGVLEHVGDMGALRDLGVDAIVFGPSLRRGRCELRRGDGVGRGEQGHVMSAGHQALGQQR